MPGSRFCAHPPAQLGKGLVMLPQSSCASSHAHCLSSFFLRPTEAPRKTWVCFGDCGSCLTGLALRCRAVQLHAGRALGTQNRPWGHIAVRTREGHGQLRVTDSGRADPCPGLTMVAVLLVCGWMPRKSPEPITLLLSSAVSSGEQPQCPEPQPALWMLHCPELRAVTGNAFVGPLAHSSQPVLGQLCSGCSTVRA